MRVIKLVFTLAIIIFWIALIQKEWGHLKLRMLNHFMPDSYEALNQMNNNPSEIDRKALARYTNYFRIITWVMPERSDGFELLGVCYYYLGKEAEARRALEKAIDFNPRFFWSHYNLGVLFYKRREFPQAAQAFKRALKASPQETFGHLLESKIYRDILRYNQFLKILPDEQFKLAYQQVLILEKVLTQKQFDPYITFPPGQWHLKMF